MADAYTNVIAIRDNYIQALYNDSVNPQPSYSIDGVAVDRDRWREYLSKQILQMQKIASTLKPVEYQSLIY